MAPLLDPHLSTATTPKSKMKTQEPDLEARRREHQKHDKKKSREGKKLSKEKKTRRTGAIAATLNDSPSPRPLHDPHAVAEPEAVSESELSDVSRISSVEVEIVAPSAKKLILGFDQEGDGDGDEEKRGRSRLPRPSGSNENSYLAGDDRMKPSAFRTRLWEQMELRQQNAVKGKRHDSDYDSEAASDSDRTSDCEIEGRMQKKKYQHQAFVSSPVHSVDEDEPQSPIVSDSAPYGIVEVTPKIYQLGFPEPSTLPIWFPANIIAIYKVDRKGGQLTYKETDAITRYQTALQRILRLKWRAYTEAAQNTSKLRKTVQNVQHRAEGDKFKLYREKQLLKWKALAIKRWKTLEKTQKGAEILAETIRVEFKRERMLWRKAL